MSRFRNTLMVVWASWALACLPARIVVDDAGDEEGSSGTTTGATGFPSTGGPSTTSLPSTVTTDPSASATFTDTGCVDDCPGTPEEVWTVTHDGPAHADDQAYDVVTDRAGNIYVVGETFVSGAGDDLWLTKLAPDGGGLWTVTRNGANNQDDCGYGLAWHPGGDLLVTGYETASNDASDLLLMRVAPADGATIWALTRDGPDALIDEGRAVASDGLGNIVVVGVEGSTQNGSNIFVAKYDGAGQELWTAVYDGPAGKSDFAHGVAVDDGGSLYVAGSVRVENVGLDAWVRKYADDGGPLWTETYGVKASDQHINAATLDQDGNVVVAGYADEQYGSRDVWIRAYSPDGDEQWTIVWDDVYHGNDEAYDLVEGPDGSLYVTGADSQPDHQRDIWSAKFSGGSDPVWQVRYNNAEANLSDFGRGIALDPSGDIIVAGYEQVLGEGTNIWIRKYAEVP